MIGAISAGAVSDIKLTVPLIVNYLVVAGGGAGSSTDRGGGGGAGGLRSTVDATGRGGTLETALTLTPATNYSLKVGGGGAVAPT